MAMIAAAHRKGRPTQPPPISKPTRRLCDNVGAAIRRLAISMIPTMALSLPKWRDSTRLFKRLRRTDDIPPLRDTTTSPTSPWLETDGHYSENRYRHTQTKYLRLVRKPNKGEAYDAKYARNACDPEILDRGGEPAQQKAAYEWHDDGQNNKIAGAADCENE